MSSTAAAGSSRLHSIIAPYLVKRVYVDPGEIEQVIRREVLTLTPHFVLGRQNAARSQSQSEIVNPLMTNAGKNADVFTAWRGKTYALFNQFGGKDQ